MNNTIKEKEIVCKECILHSGIPGIKINESGLCNLCSSTDTNITYQKKFSRFLAKKMEELFKTIKNENHKYDVLVSYSGGKDSTFLLYLLKNKYHLNPLAFSVIHPLVNDNAKWNMKEAAAKLNVDLIQYDINVEEYKKMLKYSLYNGYKYGIGERVGCITCGAIYKWASLRMATKMDIPVVADGVDRHQKQNFYQEGFLIDTNKIANLKPAGVMHDLFKDAFGEEYEKDLMSFNMKDFEGKLFPTWISPFTFLNDDYSEYLDRFLKLGLDFKKYKSLFTNCSAVHMFDYLSYRRYNCASYVREYSRLISEDDTLLDEKINVEVQTGDSIDSIDRKTLQSILDEYKKILYYIVDNKIDANSVNDNIRSQIIQMAPVSYQYYGEEVFHSFMQKILTVNDYITFFDIVPEEINPVLFKYDKVYIDSQIDSFM